MQRVNADKTVLKKFSVTMCAALFVVGVIVSLKHSDTFIWFYSAGAFFFLFGVFLPYLLRPVYVIWMKLSFILGWINTKILLLAAFYLVLTPIHLGLILFRIEPLDRKIEKNKPTYWRKRKKHVFNPLDYERQF